MGRATLATLGLGVTLQRRAVNGVKECGRYSTHLCDTAPTPARRRGGRRKNNQPVFQQRHPLLFFYTHFFVVFFLLLLLLLLLRSSSSSSYHTGRKDGTSRGEYTRRAGRGGRVFQHGVQRYYLSRHYS